MRKFETGATRDAQGDKIQFFGHMGWAALQAFGRYMHRHRQQADGQLRDADNWKKGIPTPAYVDSLIRHSVDLATLYEAKGDTDVAALRDLACAVLFNAQGILQNLAKEPR